MKNFTLYSILGIFICFTCISVDAKTPDKQAKEKVSTIKIRHKAVSLNEINEDDINDFFNFITDDALGLYYISNDTLVKISRKSTSSKFEKTLKIESTFDMSNTAGFWLSSNELELYLNGGTKGAFFHAHRNSREELFGEPVRVAINGPASNSFIVTSVASPSLTPDGNELIIFAGTYTLGKDSFDLAKSHCFDCSLSSDTKLLKCIRSGENSFNVVEEIASIKEIDDVESGQLSRDGLKYYFSRESQETYDLDVYIMKRSSLSDPFGEPEKLIIPGHTDCTMPSVSADDKYMVFEADCDDDDHENEFHIVELNKSIAKVPEKAPVLIPEIDSSVEIVNIPKVGNESLVIDQIKIYPNPVFNDHITIENPSRQAVSIQIQDETGKVVSTRNNESGSSINMDLNKLSKGIYFVIISNSTGTKTQKIIKS